MKTLIEQIKTQDSYAQFNLIPGRIFLDTNALQYLQDFGEYIFEHYRKVGNILRHEKAKSKKELGVLSDILKEFSEQRERMNRNCPQPPK